MSKYFDSENLTFMAPEVKEHGRHMVMTNVHKDTKIKYVNIDTRFQEEYTQENKKDKYADFKCKLPQPITNIQSMKVTNVEIPASFYNFSLQRKNTYFTIENTAGTKIPIVIEDGNYTLDSLATEIQSQLEDSTNGVDDIIVCIDDSTHKIRFENVTDADQNRKSTKYTFHFDVDEEGNEDKRDFKSKLGWMLGFRSTTYIIQDGGNIYSETFVNLHPFRYLYLNIDEFSQTNPNSFVIPSFNSYTNSNAIARLSLDPNSYEFGSVICASNTGGKFLSNTRTYSGKTDIQRLHVQLMDDCGNLVDLNQMDFSFAIEIEYL